MAVNYHLYRPCNLRCRFCFATFRDVRGRLPLEETRRLLALLRAAGTQKINFAGGEPTLHPEIGPIIAEARRLGFTVSLITNGARLDALLDAQASDLDWVGLSVDSADEATQAALGRGDGEHVTRSLALAARIRAAGIRLKLNTVVTALNWREDMRPFVRLMRPERWKVFQVLPVEGQNDGKVEPLLITATELDAFVARHRTLARDGLAPIVEDNDAMTGSYAMIDPIGRFYCNTAGRHTYSDPILEAGVEAAAAQVGFRFERLVERGGLYPW
ncbi:MAG: radical SAM protein [Myxococcales bacterium]|nr:radical SAM protein [Myxococcales bacterium]MCB9552327.1 radical SAM protein [Myxococcales bacterium]